MPNVGRRPWRNGHGRDRFGKILDRLRAFGEGFLTETSNSGKYPLGISERSFPDGPLAAAAVRNFASKGVRRSVLRRSEKARS